jgi:hypothetical protein
MTDHPSDRLRQIIRDHLQATLLPDLAGSTLDCCARFQVGPDIVGAVGREFRSTGGTGYWVVRADHVPEDGRRLTPHPMSLRHPETAAEIPDTITRVISDVRKHIPG